MIDQQKMTNMILFIFIIYKGETDIRTWNIYMGSRESLELSTSHHTSNSISSSLPLHQAALNNFPNTKKDTTTAQVDPTKILWIAKNGE